MALDSHNNIFGRVLNPLKPLLSAGGSSGGEGALVAMHGSALGIGTDIGGSIRIPAMCNEIYGFKPSVGRIPISGSSSGSIPSSEKISLIFSAGPITRSIRDCGLLMKAVSDAKPWERDPATHYGKWEEQGELPSSKIANGSQKLVIGVLRTDGVTTPLPPISKLVSETAQKLQRAGHTVVEVSSANNFKKCQSLASKFFSIDGNNHLLDQIDATGEPLSPWMATRVPRKPAKNVPEIIKLHAARAELQTELLGMWKTEDGREVDVIICPVAPHPVPPIDGWNAVGYTSSWVLLDCPAGTIPVRKFRDADLEGEVEGEVLSSWDKTNRDLCESFLSSLTSNSIFQLLKAQSSTHGVFRMCIIFDRQN